MTLRAQYDISIQGTIRKVVQDGSGPVTQSTNLGAWTLHLGTRYTLFDDLTCGGYFFPMVPTFPIHDCGFMEFIFHQCCVAASVLRRIRNALVDAQFAANLQHWSVGWQRHCPTSIHLCPGGAVRFSSLQSLRINIFASARELHSMIYVMTNNELPLRQDLPLTRLPKYSMFMLRRLTWSAFELMIDRLPTQHVLICTVSLAVASSCWRLLNRNSALLDSVK